MTCSEFEAMVDDLAGDRLMDAMTRRRLTIHAGQCPNCANRLDAERALNEHLATLAEITEHVAPDPSLKRDLLSAFTTLHAQRSHLTLQKTAPQRSSQQRWLVAAAAALVVSMLGVATLYFRSSPEALENAENRPAPTARATDTIAPSPSPAETLRKSQEPQLEKPSLGVPAPRRRPANMRTVGAPTLASLTSEETTTDYLPLTYVGDQTSLQSGVVVRIEIPRATLLAMGLPMNSERGNSLVKADVVVGDDGVARAIRLVQ